MLQVASFKISDAEGINKLLSQYRLASGAHILVSEGQVCIPYEDGEPENRTQAVVRVREDQNKLRTELSLITHSQGVMALILADAEDRFNVADAAWSKNKSNKELEARKLGAAKGVEDAKAQIRSNEFEIIRIQRNLDLYDEAVKKLNG